MNKIEYQISTINFCVGAARKITFGLAIFSLVAIYITAYDFLEFKKEQFTLENEQKKVKILIVEGSKVLSKIRSFYEGPVEEDHLTFSSFIYALEITDHHLKNTLSEIERNDLSKKDIAFLNRQGRSISDNVFELRSIVSGLIELKYNRVSFDQLNFPDLLDVDYHKGKDAWYLYYEWSSLNSALSTTSKLNNSPLTNNLTSLEKRYQDSLSKSMEGRSQRTIPKITVNRIEVKKYLDKLKKNGFFSIGSMKRKSIEIDKKIAANAKKEKITVKLPFIDQDIDSKLFILSVPAIILITVLFILFYVSKAKQSFMLIIKEPERNFYPSCLPVWVALPQDRSHRLLKLVSGFLKILIFVLPLLSVMSILMLITTTLLYKVIGTILAIIFIAIVWIISMQLASFKYELA